MKFIFQWQSILSAMSFGSRECIEKLKHELGLFQLVIMNFAKDIKENGSYSWKFPHTTSHDVDVLRMLPKLEFVSNNKGRNQLVHMFLLELIVDRFVFLLQLLLCHLDGMSNSNFQAVYDVNVSYHVPSIFGLAKRLLENLYNMRVKSSIIKEQMSHDALVLSRKFNDSFARLSNIFVEQQGCVFEGVTAEVLRWIDATEKEYGTFRTRSTKQKHGPTSNEHVSLQRSSVAVGTETTKNFYLESFFHEGSRSLRALLLHLSIPSEADRDCCETIMKFTDSANDEISLQCCSVFSYKRDLERLKEYYFFQREHAHLLSLQIRSMKEDFEDKLQIWKINKVSFKCLFF